MTHSDAGNYAAKHKDKSIPESLRQALEAGTTDNRLSCSAAHKIAQETGFTPKQTGRAADLMEMRLSGCQLGLFGHGKKEKIKAAANPDKKLEQVLQNSLENGKLACLTAWEIAAQFNLKKTDITAACEACEIKISPCQLGAF